MNLHDVQGDFRKKQRRLSVHGYLIAEFRARFTSWSNAKPV